MALYKQLCSRCKKNYILISSRRRDKYVTCYECQKSELSKPIKTKKMQKLFDLPEEFYKESAFLRSIKINYIKYGNLTERQLEAFKKVVEDMKKETKSSE
jgi:hypothetical protein